MIKCCRPNPLIEDKYLNGWYSSEAAILEISLIGGSRPAAVIDLSLLT